MRQIRKISDLSEFAANSHELSHLGPPSQILRIKPAIIVFLTLSGRRLF